jgi:hypothetical protein
LLPPDTLRVPVDCTWAKELAEFLRAQLKDAPAPQDVEGQIQAALLAGYCRDLGLLRYAEGAGLDDVRRLLRASAECTLAVFRLRDADPDSADLSLTNSRRGLHAMELALSCGASDVAGALAPLIWDPPGASYLGPDSVVCTPEDQRLAYALRDILLHRVEKGGEELHALKPADRGQEIRASLLTALTGGDETRFSQALAESHAFHLKRVEMDQIMNGDGLKDLDDLLDVPTLAYLSLGISRMAGLGLPAQDAYLPVELTEGGVVKDS